MISFGVFLTRRLSEVVLHESGLRQPINRRLLVLCIVFIVWSILGLHQLGAFWIPQTKWWGVFVYILVHFGLAGMILRSSGFRLWSIALCLVGLVSVERDMLLAFYAFTAWKFGGFV